MTTRIAACARLTDQVRARIESRMIGSVTVRIDGLVQRAWKAADDGVVTVKLVGARALETGQIHVIERLVEETNTRLEQTTLDLDGLPTVGRGVTQIETGVAWTIESQHPDGPARWLRSLTTALDASNVEGTLSAYEFPVVPGSFGEPPSVAEPRWATVVMAMSHWSLYGSNAVSAPWRDDKDPRARLIELALDFLGDSSGTFELGNGTISTPSWSALPALLDESLSADLSEVPCTWLRKYGVAENLEVSFDAGAHLLLTVVSGSAFPDRLMPLLDLVESWAGQCDWIGLVENGVGTGIEHSLRVARGERLRDQSGAHMRAQDPHTLPDAFCWQIITEAHLAAANDLRDWSVTEISPGRYKVVASDLAAWLASPSRLHTPVPHALLRRARDDFGPALRR